MRKGNPCSKCLLREALRCPFSVPSFHTRAPYRQTQAPILIASLSCAWHSYASVHGPQCQWLCLISPAQLHTCTYMTLAPLLESLRPDFPRRGFSRATIRFCTRVRSTAGWQPRRKHWTNCQGRSPGDETMGLRRKPFPSRLAATVRKKTTSSPGQNGSSQPARGEIYGDIMWPLYCPGHLGGVSGEIYAFSKGREGSQGAEKYPTKSVFPCWGFSGITSSNQG